jgi:hypothetical protein
MVGASGLEDDANDLALLEPRQQGSKAFGVVGELACNAVGVAIDVERVFGNGDADSLGYRGTHLQVLCLSSGPKARVSVQAARKREGRSHFSSAHHGRQ